MRKLKDFLHIPVRSSYTDCLFYKVFIVCYLLIEYLKKTCSPLFYLFLRLSLCCFWTEGYFFIKTVQASLRVHVSKAIFSIFRSFIFFNSHNLNKKNDCPIFLFLYYLVNLYKDCKMFKKQT